MTQRLPTPTKTTRGVVVGRPRKHPPVGAAATIRKLAAQGLAQRDLAARLGASEKTLRLWLREDEGLALAFAQGREAERNELHKLLVTSARTGKAAPVAAIFLLKARHHYREQAPDEAEQRANVTINLPGAMTVEQFQKGVTVDVTPGQQESGHD